MKGEEVAVEDDGVSQGEIDMLEKQLEAIHNKIQQERALASKALESISRDTKLLNLCDEQLEQKLKDLKWSNKQNASLITESRLYQLSTREFDFPLVDQLESANGKLVVELAKACKQMELHLRAIQMDTASAPTTTIKTVQIELIPNHGPNKRTNVPVLRTSTFGDVMIAACEYWSLNEANFQLEYSGVDDASCLVVRMDHVPFHITELILREHHNHDPRILPSPALPSSPPLSPSTTPPAIVQNEAMEQTPVGFTPRRPHRDSRCFRQIELLLTILLATSFVIVTLETASVGLAYQSRDAMKRTLADQHDFQLVSSPQAMFQWIRQLQQNTVQLVAPAVIGQLRVPNNTDCASVLAGTDCFADFSAPQQDVLFPVVASPAFQYTPPPTADACWPALAQDAIPGMYLYYPARQTDYYSTQIDSESTITELETNQWVDTSTRLVTVTFTTAAALQCSANVYVNVIAAFEFLPGGAVLPKWLSTAVFPRASYVAYDIVFIVFVCIVVVLGRFVRNEKKRWWDLLLLPLTDVLLVIFAALYYAAQDQLRQVFSTCASLQQVDFRGMAIQTSLVANLQGVVIVLLSVRMIKFLNTSPATSFLLRVLAHMMPSYLVSLLILACMASAFALVGHFAFGRQLGNLAMVDLSFASLWLSFGPSAAFVGTSTWGAMVLSLLAYVSLYLVTFSLFLAVVASSYFYVGDEVRRNGHAWLLADTPSKVWYFKTTRHSGQVEEVENSKRSFG